MGYFCMRLFICRGFYFENHVTTKYHVMQTALDERIPFIEYFIVPYLMWFAFIAVVFLYFFFTDVQDFISWQQSHLPDDDFPDYLYLFPERTGSQTGGI